jgi:hypothetical protein
LLETQLGCMLRYQPEIVHALGGYLTGLIGRGYPILTGGAGDQSAVRWSRILVAVSSGSFLATASAGVERLFGGSDPAVAGQRRLFHPLAIT